MWWWVQATNLVVLVQVGIKFPDSETSILPDMESVSVINQSLDATSEIAIQSR